MLELFLFFISPPPLKHYLQSFKRENLDKNLEVANRPQKISIFASIFLVRFSSYLTKYYLMN
jgi:hypothetical protein